MLVPVGCVGKGVHTSREIQVLGRDGQQTWFSVYSEWTFSEVFVSSRLVDCVSVVMWKVCLWRFGCLCGMWKMCLW